MEQDKQLPNILSRGELYSQIHNFFSIRNTTGADEWISILSGIEGALYCLDKARQFECDRDNWQDEAEELSSKLIENDVINEKDYPAWFIGYYLNNTELRILSALHRMLKAFLGKNGKISDLIIELSKRITDSENVQALITARAELRKLRFKYKDDKEAASVSRVWSRVNEMKHENEAIFDDESPEIRYSDAAVSIAFLLKLYEEFLIRKGILGKT
jgi:hypothetical protein